MRKKVGKINLWKAYRCAGFVSMGVMGVLGLMLIFPIVDREVSALTNTTVNSETRVSVKAAASVAVSVANQINIDVVPKSTGSFGYSSTRLGISTNNEEGYQVFLKTGDGSSKLINTDISKTGSSYEISSIDGDMLGTDFTGNTWGYVLSQDPVSENSTYSPVPTDITSIKTTTSASAGGEDVYNLGFGTHVSTALPAGEYSNSVIVSVVANPITISSLSQLVYMQDMQPEFCDNAEVGTTKQLYDVRDGKKYWVAKLADGNCWMTQNLALDLSTDKALTPGDSDVKENWVPGANTNAERLIGSKGDANFTSAYSWSFGQIVLATPINRTKCVNYDSSDAATSDDDLGEVCRQSRVVDVSDVEWQPTFASQAGEFDGESYDYVTVDETNKTYDAHYLIGNYYQYNTATAGSGKDLLVKNENAESSICPKGWRLPVSGADDSGAAIVNPNETKGSYYQLFLAYGYKDSNFTGGGDDILPSDLSASSRENILVAPIYLAAAGIVTLNYGYLRNFPTSASVLTATTYSSTHDLFLTIGSTVNPVAHDSKHYGYSVRCLAK